MTSQEEILEAAVAVVRRGGLRALSARAVAQRLGCSTQPIYRAYESMEKLEHAVLERTREIAMGFLLDANSCDGEQEAEDPFVQLGCGTLRFAQQEPELFRLVGQLGPVLCGIQRGEPPPRFVLERMRMHPRLAGASDEQLYRVHALMWFFSQGLATIFLSDVDGDPMSMAKAWLALAGRAVVASEVGEQKEADTGEQS